MEILNLELKCICFYSGYILRNMKLGKAYERGSFHSFRFKGVIWYYMHRFRFHSEHSAFIIYPKSWDLFRHRNTPPIIIELHCKWRRPTRTDTENFIGRYRILYIFQFFFYLISFKYTRVVYSRARQSPDPLRGPGLWLPRNMKLGKACERGSR
jgi:hypothetical protein